MTLTFHRTEERLLIKYIDDAFNIFTCIIPYHDKFVVDYCNSKLEKLEKLLKNHIIKKHDNKIIISDNLNIPHIEFLKRDFVIKPMKEIAPEIFFV